MSIEEEKNFSQFRGNKLKNLRIERGLSQIDLARETGMSKQLISKIEKGGSFAVKTAANLAEYYQVDIKWLMEDEFDLESYKRHLDDPGRQDTKVKRKALYMESRFDLFVERVTKHIMDLDEKVKELSHRVQVLEGKKLKEKE